MSVPPPDPFDAIGLRATTAVELFPLDPRLAEQLPASEMRRAGERAWARVVALPAGIAALPADAGSFPGWFGLLVLDGLLLRRVEVGRASWPELLGDGDLMRPWTTAGDALSSIPSHARFEVLAPARVALLDRAFAQRVAPWPEIAAALLERAVERSHWLASHLAAGQPALIDERVWMVLWHLADRWGTTSAAGVELGLPSLSHRVLAEMLGARRPTVSLAVRRLAAAGFLTHVPRQGWTLHARPEAFPSSAGRRERARAGPPA